MKKDKPIIYKGCTVIGDLKPTADGQILIGAQQGNNIIINPNGRILLNGKVQFIGYFMAANFAAALGDALIVQAQGNAIIREHYGCACGLKLKTEKTDLFTKLKTIFKK